MPDPGVRARKSDEPKASQEKAAAESSREVGLNSQQEAEALSCTYYVAHED